MNILTYLPSSIGKTLSPRDLDFVTIPSALSSAIARCIRTLRPRRQRAAAQPPEANATSAKQFVLYPSKRPVCIQTVHCFMRGKMRVQQRLSLKLKLSDLHYQRLSRSIIPIYSAKLSHQGQGGINQATKHKDVKYFFLSALTGHAGDNNSSQYYINLTDVGRTVPVPAVNLCMERKDLKTPIVPFLQLLTLTHLGRPTRLLLGTLWITCLSATSKDSWKGVIFTLLRKPFLQNLSCIAADASSRVDG